MGKTKKDNKYDKEFAVRKPNKPVAKKKERKPTRSNIGNFDDDDELMDMEVLEDVSFLGNDNYEEDDE